MMRAAGMVMVVVVAMATALPASQPRYVNNPTTGNQVLSNIVEKAVEKITALGWETSKRGQNGKTQLPMHEESGTNERFSVTSVSITGLGFLRRSKTALFNADKSELTGTVVVDNAQITGSYTAEFPGYGAAPYQAVSGKVTETVGKLFADIVVRLNSDLIPQSIKSYTVRPGHDEVDVTGLGNNNPMEPLYLAGFRKAIRQTLEDTMRRNIKVQINQAIQDIKKAAAA
ncbi:hypothetical protein GWK47_017101 [Chionoecetes opilio]|uniref:Uncharacterized protein n=1 Tax=Chionoecetes opilio TaxID=41210 RepID=A0A8J5CJ98_CHIOP|nr:hypothetical protein GWK47_017101 [Chionoecetes opilio]